MKKLNSVKILGFSVVILHLGCLSVLAAGKTVPVKTGEVLRSVSIIPYYSRQATWQDTMLATRVAADRREAELIKAGDPNSPWPGVSLGPWWTIPLSAKPLAKDVIVTDVPFPPEEGPIDVTKPCGGLTWVECSDPKTQEEQCYFFRIIRAVEPMTIAATFTRGGYLYQQVKRCMRAKVPVISVDTKKKELVGAFHNKGRRWGKKQKLVNTYDFPSLAEGRAYPYGLYDEAQNEGFVNVGVSHDTAEFAVESIDRWWRMLGCRRYPNATKLLITADGGGSNGSRNRLWKYSIQQFADRHGLAVMVCHFPPGTSKWNKVEHRLFSQISVTWRGEPLVSYETIINFISSTTTKSGLKVKAELDTHEYETGKKITDEQMHAVRAKPHATHPQWNYTIRGKT